MLYARFSVHKFTTVTEGSFVRRHDYHVLWHKYYVLYFQEKYLADGLEVSISLPGSSSKEAAT